VYSSAQLKARAIESANAAAAAKAAAAAAALPPPLPANGYRSASTITISSAAEVTAMKQGLTLYGTQTLTTGAVQIHGGHHFGAKPHTTWVSNMACKMYQADPTKYPTVAALNNAAWAKYQAMLKADNSGGFLNFIGNYVQPAVQAIVLWEVGGAFYSGVTAGGAGATATSSELAGSTVNLANSGTAVVDTGSQALANTGQLVDLGNTTGTVLDTGGAALNTGGTLLDGLTTVGGSLGDSLVTTGESLISGKIAGAIAGKPSGSVPQGQNAAQPAASQPPSKSGLWAMIGIGALVIAKLFVFS
jgi:hypothetical protein